MKGTLTTALMIGGALAAGAGAAYFTKGYISNEVRSEREQLQAQYKLTSVVVAKSDLAPGSVLSARTVALREVPKTFLHADAIGSERWSDIAGRVLSRAVRLGRPRNADRSERDLLDVSASRTGSGRRLHHAAR